jgi:hypothetical protein
LACWPTPHEANRAECVAVDWSSVCPR